MIVQWNGEEGTPAPIVQEIGVVDRDVEPPSRLNDGKADPMGRLYAGTHLLIEVNIIILPHVI